jgi:cytochrome P450
MTIANAEVTQPKNAILAVTHRDPSAFYQTIAVRPPWFDADLGMWVVASNRDVTAVLTSGAAKVRPKGESCPRHLTGSPAGDTFQRIARMNDGDAHQEIRSTIDTWFASITPGRIDEACEQAAEDLRAQTVDEPSIHSWMFVFPSAVMTRLMGIKPAATPALATAAKGLGDAFGPGAGPETLDAANAAITAIADALDEPRKAMANGAAGFLFQTYDATAALIGNTITHLARTAPTGAQPEDVPTAIDCVLSDDPAIHNTRRFLDTELHVGGVTIPAGATVLLVLAAAIRDRVIRDSASVAFGAGHHRCPADQLAPAIACRAVQAIMKFFGDEPLPLPVGYLPRQNARIPLFTDKATP